MSRSLDAKRIALWLDASADQLLAMRDLKIEHRTLQKIQDNYGKLAFLTRVAGGKAYLLGGKISKNNPEAS